MDRRLELLSGGSYFAVLEFAYEAVNAGNVSITLYKKETEGAMESVIPVAMYQRQFTHGPLDSMEAIREFDREFCREQVEEAGIGEQELAYSYPSQTTEKRFLVMTAGNVTGIATIRANFAANEKHLSFVSASRISNDRELDSDSLECNPALVERAISEDTAPDEELQVMQVY